MNWLTTCPHCRTTFRVGQEQLDAHGGDVRCGKCQHVFNASLALKPEAGPEPAPAPISEEPEPEVVAIEALLPQGEVPPEEAAAEEAPGLAPVEIEEIVLTALPGAPLEEESPEAPPSHELESAPTLAPVAEEAPPEKPRRRLAWLWLLASLFLMGALAVQALYAFRIELASRAPALKPLLVQLCGVLQCRVGLPRNIASLGIDGSDLQADPLHPGVLIMSAVLRSRSVYVQQYPLLELTLTDTADKALARRVFQPAEYLPQGRDPAAGMPGAGEVAVRLNLHVGDLQPVGYRLYLFYSRDAEGDS